MRPTVALQVCLLTEPALLFPPLCTTHIPTGCVVLAKERRIGPTAVPELAMTHTATCHIAYVQNAD